MFKRSRSILVATNSLNMPGGTETFTYTLIEELVRRKDCFIEYFTFERGEISKKIEEDLRVGFKSKNKYDLILANHYTCVDKLYRSGFIIQTCHGIFPKLEQPNYNANGFVSISKEIQDHLKKLGVPSKIIYNSINLDRFRSKIKINQSLKTVLSLCHAIEANMVIKEVCKDLSIDYIEANKYKEPIWEMEEIINQSDVVIGLGRSVYEAMACGRPVIVFDKRGYFPSYGDGYLGDKFELSLLNNCSGRYSKKELSKEGLKDEVLKYNYKDSDYFRHFAEKKLDVRKNVEKYLNFYFSIKDLPKKKRIYLKLNKKVFDFYKKVKVKLSLIFNKK